MLQVKISSIDLSQCDVEHTYPKSPHSTWNNIQIPY